jgi:hypothetical protein
MSGAERISEQAEAKVPLCSIPQQVVRYSEKSMQGFFPLATAGSIVAYVQPAWVSQKALTGVNYATGPGWNGVDLLDVIGALKDLFEGKATWHTYVRIFSFLQMAGCTTWSAFFTEDEDGAGHILSGISFGNAMLTSSLPYVVELMRQGCGLGTGFKDLADKSTRELVYMALWWLSSAAGAYLLAANVKFQRDEIAWTGLACYSVASVLRIGEFAGALESEFFKGRPLNSSYSNGSVYHALEHKEEDKSRSRGCLDRISAWWNKPASQSQPSSCGWFSWGRRSSANGSVSSTSHVYKEGAHKDDGNYSISESFSQSDGIKLGVKS